MFRLVDLKSIYAVVAYQYSAVDIWRKLGVIRRQKVNDLQ